MDEKELAKNKYIFFRLNLLKWYERADRPTPWKEEKNPYLIWLSEIILQQTRVEQGKPYYQRFKEKYPNVEALAAAPQDDVMKLWEGLGYYSRARNMHQTAQFIVRELNGKFPDTYEAILQLKGVGPYTAAAIASFAYNLPHAVVDGNVFRVLSRYLGSEQAIDTTAGKKFFQQQAQLALDAYQAGRYNQAIMDFGAMICTPKKPNCPSCPLNSRCSAFLKRQVDRFPIKTKKIERRSRYFHYLLFNLDDHIYIRKRIGKDIWQNLYEFPLIETSQIIADQAVLKERGNWKNWTPPEKLPPLRSRSRPFKQTLTHQIIIAVFWEFDLLSNNSLNENNLLLVKRKNLSKFAFPKIVDWYLSDNSLYLNLQ